MASVYTIKNKKPMGLLSDSSRNALAARFSGGGNTGSPPAAVSPFTSGGTPLPAPNQADPYSTDSTYQQQLDLSSQKLNNAIASSANNQNELATLYGINATYDGSGNLQSTSIDPNVDVNNPFSRASLLKRSFDRDKRATMNSYAGMGQFGSGAYEAAQKQNSFNFEQGNDSMVKNFRSAIQNILQSRRDAELQAQQEKMAAEAALLDRNLANRDNASTPWLSSGGLETVSPWDQPTREQRLQQLRDSIVGQALKPPTLKTKVKKGR